MSLANYLLSVTQQKQDAAPATTSNSHIGYLLVAIPQFIPCVTDLDGSLSENEDDAFILPDVVEAWQLMDRLEAAYAGRFHFDVEDYNGQVLTPPSAPTFYPTCPFLPSFPEALDWVGQVRDQLASQGRDASLGSMIREIRRLPELFDAREMLVRAAALLLDVPVPDELDIWIS